MAKKQMVESKYKNPDSYIDRLKHEVWHARNRWSHYQAEYEKKKTELERVQVREKLVHVWSMTGTLDQSVSEFHAFQLDSWKIGDVFWARGTLKKKVSDVDYKKGMVVIALKEFYRENR